MTMTDKKIIPLNAWKGSLSVGPRGYKKTMTNLMLCLKGIPEFGRNLRFNEFSYRVEWGGEPFEEYQLVDAKLILESHEIETNDKDLLPAIVRHARENAYHPVRDYLNSLQWDGTKRLEKWMQLCLGVEDSIYTRAVGRKMLIAAVARAYTPGCKVDTMLVLEGPQGLRKSSAIAALFGNDWTAESVNLFDQHNKMVMAMMGAWCVELAEFVAALKRDQNMVKGLISMKSDKVVLPYAKMSTNHARQCVFIGTINPGQFGYLTDATGNRRYWPVSCTKIDLDLIRERRDQLWAEAVAEFEGGAEWWLDDGEDALAVEQAAKREESDVWEEILSSKLEGCNEVNIAMALRELGMPNDRLDKVSRDRAAKALRRLGFQSGGKTERWNGTPCLVFRRV